MNLRKARQLIPAFKEMSPEQFQEEIDAIFELAYAVLEVSESDSIEFYPNADIKMKISCEILKDSQGKYYC